MKKHLILVIVGFLAIVMADKAMAAAVLNGVIQENRRGGSPLPGVVVSARGAKMPFETTNSGEFTRR